MLEAIQLAMHTHNMKLTLSASISIAVFLDNALADEGLLKCADFAMCQAKESGRKFDCLLYRSDYTINKECDSTHF